MDTEARLDRLERQMRFYKRLTVVLTLVIVAGVSMGQADDYEEITCRGLTVVNEKGAIVATLKSWELGGKLFVYGVNGVTTAISQNDGGNGLLNTYSSSGKQLVDLGATVNDDGALVTYSSSGKKLVGLGATVNDDGGALSIYNKTGEVVCTMYPDDYGNGVIGAWNRKGKGRTFESR